MISLREKFMYRVNEIGVQNKEMSYEIMHRLHDILPYTLINDTIRGELRNATRSKRNK